MVTLSERLRTRAWEQYESRVQQFKLRQASILRGLPEPAYRAWHTYEARSNESLAVHILINGLGQGIQRHHVIPRCVWKCTPNYDVDGPENIVWVTPDEHFYLHQMLIACYRGLPEEARMRGTVELIKQLRSNLESGEARKRLSSSPKTRARHASRRKSSVVMDRKAGRRIRRRIEQITAEELSADIDSAA